MRLSVSVPARPDAPTPRLRPCQSRSRGLGARSLPPTQASAAEGYQLGVVGAIREHTTSIGALLLRLDTRRTVTPPRMALFRPNAARMSRSWRGAGLLSKSLRQVTSVLLLTRSLVTETPGRTVRRAERNQAHALRVSSRGGGSPCFFISDGLAAALGRPGVSVRPIRYTWSNRTIRELLPRRRGVIW